MAGVTRVAWIAALLLAAPLARGAVIELVNTFPAAGVPLRSGYPVAAPGGDWWEIAVPFRVPVPGYLRRIETGLHFSEGSTAAIEVVVTRGRFFPTADPPGEPDGHEFADVDISDVLVSDTPEGRDWCRFRYDAATRCLRLDDFENYRWRGAELAGPGEYWIVTRIPMEEVFGAWHANSGLLQDDFATRSKDIGRAFGIFEDYEAVPWMIVSEMGPGARPGGAYPAPALRVLFEPLVVAEPGSLALLAVGVVALGVGRRRRASGRDERI